MGITRHMLQKSIATILVMVFVFTPAHIVVNAITGDDIKQVEEDVQAIEKYFIVEENGNVLYNRDVAIEDGISTEMLDFADQVYAFGMSQSNESEKIVVIGQKKSVAAAESKATAFPIYGNWCGPNYGSGKPIDLLDKGCKNHDLCYKDKGRHRCSCDKTFLSYINSNYDKMTGTKQKAMAKVIKTWLQIKTKNVTKKGGNFSCRK